MPFPLQSETTGSESSLETMRYRRCAKWGGHSIGPTVWLRKGIDLQHRIEGQHVRSVVPKSKKR